jgi:hypothetical protein
LPVPRAITDACLAAVEKVAVNPHELSNDAKKNHHSLAPQIADSYWCQLDHSLSFLQIELHPEIIELARQLSRINDIYFRNRGINELAPGRGFLWHRDSEWDYIEFMHYFSNASVADGCLRVLPGSHVGEKEQWLGEVTRLRREQSYEDPPTLEGPADVKLEGEHRWKSHRISWLCGVQRFCTRPGRMKALQVALCTIGCSAVATNPITDSLSDEQKEVLWLDPEFDIHEKYIGERELGKVMWGVV